MASSPKNRVYRADADAVVILAIFRKTTGRRRPVIDVCIRRLREYDRA
jgi:hypothetical protein